MEMIKFVITCLKTYYPGLIGENLNNYLIKYFIYLYL